MDCPCSYHPSSLRRNRSLIVIGGSHRRGLTHRLAQPVLAGLQLQGDESNQGGRGALDHHQALDIVSSSTEN